MASYCHNSKVCSDPVLHYPLEFHLWIKYNSSIVCKRLFCPVDWCWKIHRLQPFREVRPTPQKCLEYDTKQSDCEVPVILLKFWGMRSTLSLPSLPGSLWPEVVAPDRVPSIGQIELNSVLMLNWITWNRTVLTFKPFEMELVLYAKLNCLKMNCFWL